VALVSQLTVDRLQNLRRLCDHWTGHMSVAVYVLSDSDVEEVHQLRKSFSKVRNNVDFHLTYAEEVQ
jgi:CHAD domain-containing protein